MYENERPTPTSIIILNKNLEFFYPELFTLNECGRAKILTRGKRTYDQETCRGSDGREYVHCTCMNAFVLFFSFHRFSFTFFR